MSSGGNYGGGDYGGGNYGTGDDTAANTPSSYVVEGTAVSQSVTAQANTYASPSMDQHPSEMPDAKMKV